MDTASGWRFTETPYKYERNGLILLQQRCDERTFFGQKRFGPENARVVTRAFFVTVGGQDCRTNGEWARRLYACHPKIADCCQCVLGPAQTKPRQAECCASLPVSRLLSDKHVRFALRCFGLIARSAE